MLNAAAEPLFANPAVPIGLIAIAAIIVAFRWFVWPLRGMPEPQHGRRRLHVGRFGGTYSLTREPVKGPPTWEWPERLDADYDGDSEIIEDGADRFREFLLGGTRTAFTR